MNIMRPGINIIIILLLMFPAVLMGQEDMHFSLDTWVTEGQTKWRHDSGHPRFGVPTSELDYQGVNSTVVEFGVLRQLAKGHDLEISIGAGSIDSGLLIDDDYLSASGATYYGATQSGAHRFSRTHSDINGSDLFYLNGRFAPVDFHLDGKFVDIQFSFNYQYWEEEYKAIGVRSVECTVLGDTDITCLPAGSSTALNKTVITNKVQWSGFGIAIDGVLNLTSKLALDLDAVFYPMMTLKNDDTHHLRGDLAQNPSIRMTGNGMGYDMTLGLRYHLAERFNAHIGYRVWERWVKNQTITFYGSNGGSSSSDLMDFRTRREGFIAGVSFQFN